jgi:hypothetical protein
VGSPLAAPPVRQGGFVLWFLWTVACVGGQMFGLVVVGLWYAFAQFGIEPVGATFDLASQLLSALAIFAMEFVVLWFVMGLTSSAAKAWIPVSVLVSTAEFVVLTLWVPAQARYPTGGIQLLPDLIVLGEAGILGLAQGLLLAEMLGSRSAVWIWTGGSLGVALVSEVMLTAVSSLAFVTLNQFLSLVLLLATSGVIFGALYGILLLIAVRAAARANQRRALATEV